MLYVSAAFLFLFLPLALGAYMFAPARYRKYVLLSAGVLFYIFANLSTPLAIPVLAAVALLTFFAGKKLARTCNRAVFYIIIGIEIAALIALRIVYEASGGSFVFPLGSAVYLLMSVSYLIDIRRGDCEPGGIVDSLIYLTYFPVMAAGPVIKYKDFKKYIGNVSFNTNNFADGARLFAIGFIEVIAISAVMTATYRNIIGISSHSLNAAFGLLGAMLVYAASFFAIAGWTDMGTGISLMFGINIPRDCGFAPAAYSPSGYFKKIFKGFNNWVDDYLTAPLISALGNKEKLASLLSTAIPVLAVSLFIKTTYAMLASTLIASAIVALFSITKADKMLKEKVYMRPFGWLITTVLMIFFWTAVTVNSPYSLFEFFRELSFTAVDFKIYYVSLARSGSKLISVTAAALLVLVPFSYYDEAITRKVPKKIIPPVDAILMLLLLSAFVFTALFFMPQYPYYASHAFDYLVF